MASRVNSASTPILEIGAGTGAITQALLERAVSPDCLFIIERDPELAEFLRHKFPGVRVRCGDAIHARRILSDLAVPCVQTVVSSLPLRNLSPADRAQNVDAMLDSLAHDGQLIQYTYASKCPISVRRFGLDAECLGRVWQNLPPAAVWRFVKRPEHAIYCRPEGIAAYALNRSLTPTCDMRELSAQPLGTESTFHQ
jgi:phosphatidylethanolamine/phosphatidyl-N-methylethanolamine N-methyltransferase